jgi:hypothetical protein
MNSTPATRIDGTLDIDGRSHLPANLAIRRLNIDLAEDQDFPRLPANLRTWEFCATGQDKLVQLQNANMVENRLDLTDCKNLTTLPENLTCVEVVLANCTALAKLPEGLDCNFLNIQGCTSLTAFPRRGKLVGGKLNARGCVRLKKLPAWVNHLTELDLRDCTALAKLPDGLVVYRWVDIGNTAVRRLPKSLKEAQADIRWNGVKLPDDVAYNLNKITAKRILAEANIEVRRVMIEILGYEQFAQQADVQELDADFDPGGQRRLIRIELPPVDGIFIRRTQEEPVVLVTYHCPSTGRFYATRVPPTMQTCRQAVAWIAGFDDPDQYNPVIEA